MAVTINGTTGIDKVQDGSITAADLDTTYLTPTGDGSGLTDLPGGGKILQCVVATKVDAWSTSSDTFTTVSGLAATITPTSSTSKILIIAHITTSRDTTTSNWCGDHARMIVNTSTVLPVGTHSAGSHDQQSLGGGLRYLTNYHATQSTHANLLHEPATTSSLTYEWQVCRENYAGGSVHVNRSGAPSTTYSGTGVSTITVMEIAA